MPSGQSVLDGGMLYSLNSSAYWYAQQLENGAELDQIISAAWSHFEAQTDDEKQRITSELHAFLSDLSQKGIINGYARG